MGGMKKIIYNFYNKFKVNYKDGIYEFAIYSKKDACYFKIELDGYDLIDLLLYIIYFIFLKMENFKIKKERLICHFPQKLLLLFEDNFFKIYIYSEIKGEHYYVYLYDREFKKFVYKLIKFYIRRGVL